MKINYKPLWKLLIDRDLKKKDLCEMAEISPASVTKMGKCGHVTTETLEKICLALDCKVEDIMELVPGEQEVMAEAEEITQEPTKKGGEHYAIHNSRGCKKIEGKSNNSL